MREIRDDKASHVIPFILETRQQFLNSQAAENLHKDKVKDNKNDRPFFIGLNGVQGAGKSVLVSILLETLAREPHDLNVAILSLDDVYLTHTEQIALSQRYVHNPLLQHRGQPGTHDIPLAGQVFDSLKRGTIPTLIPRYDKSAFAGQGDRLPREQWETVNPDANHKIDIVLFEGWCVGFRALADDVLETKHREAITAAADHPESYYGRLGHNTLQSAIDINTALKDYNFLTDQLDTFIHIDAADPLYVYKWRLEQEETLRRTKGSGMTDEQVKSFVDGYYPAYELYTDPLRQGVFKFNENTISSTNNKTSWEGKQLRLTVDEDRKVTQIIRI